MVAQSFPKSAPLRSLLAWFLVVDGPLLLSPGTFACPVPICPSCPPPIIVDTAGEGFHLTSAQDGVDVDIAADDSRPSKQYERDDARVVVLRQYL